MELTKEEIKRFESKFLKSDGCWEWIGPKFDAGYGMFFLSRRHGRRTYAAHRISWSIRNGRDIPNGMWICHTCDNRICVNPDHLYLGTPRQNNLDTVRRGRANRTIGSECSWSKVTEEQVLEILRSPYGPGDNALLAKKFGISQSQVSHIRNGRGWSHVRKFLQTVDVKTGLIAGTPDRVVAQAISSQASQEEGSTTRA